MTFLHPGRDAQAIARVTERKDSSVLVQGDPQWGGRTAHAKLQLRVTPEGQPAFVSELSTWEQLGLGDMTYVLYNPGHPEKCSIDWDRYQAEFGKHNPIPKLPADHAAVIASAQANPGSLEEVMKAQGHVWHGAPAAPAPAASSQVADLEKLADLKTRGLLTDAEFASEKRKLLGE
jgi:hypothetical protein